MKKEWGLLAAITLSSLLLGLAVIRWQAPTLLGLPGDLALVQVSRKLPPFYNNVFHQEPTPSSFLLPDPLTRVRGLPFLPAGHGSGPHDVLGFRNASVPHVADVVVIGDSQTYGNNVPLADNWPSRLQHHLHTAPPILYSMATGGWGAAQYLEIFPKALLFQPRVVVVAFYSGNDPLDSFLMAYGSETWAHLRPDPALTDQDAPPSPEQEPWTVRFSDTEETSFTPHRRLASNADHPAARAGWKILQQVATTLNDLAEKANIALVFTLIPTKELVYEKKVTSPPAAYVELVTRESQNIAQFAEFLGKLPHARYVDLVLPLQQAALSQPDLYPNDDNGHPWPPGYDTIAETLAPAITPHLPASPHGLVTVVDKGQYSYQIVRDEARWIIPSEKILELLGWPPGEIPSVTPRDLAAIPLAWLPHHDLDPALFGPQAFPPAPPATPPPPPDAKSGSGPTVSQ